MENTITNTESTCKIDARLPQKTKIASCCFMGLGQLIYLKQYVRGILMMIFEVILILCCTPVFKSVIPANLYGVITLGSPKPEGTPIKMLDHSIFMLIEGLFTIIILGIFIILYISQIKTGVKDAERIIKRGRYPTAKEIRNHLATKSFPVIGITPSLLMLSIFTLIPLLFSMLIAFTNYSSPDHIPPKNLVDWVGFSNFTTMFSRNVGGNWPKAFARVAGWTLLWAVLSTFTCFFVGFMFAVILRDKRIQFPKFFRTVFILPYAIPQMLSLFVWANLLNGTFGPINRTLQYWHIIQQGIPWLSNPTFAKLTLVLVNIWIGFPYSMILTTSSMTAISQAQYEAAQIDGASRWQQFIHITFPLVMYQLKPALIMQFAGNINNFGAVFFLTGGGPNLMFGTNNLTISTQAGSTDLLISWIYKLTMNTPNQYQLASVLSILVFIVLVPFALYNFTHTKAFKDGEL